jgi:hypothetical protein
LKEEKVPERILFNEIDDDYNLSSSQTTTVSTLVTLPVRIQIPCVCSWDNESSGFGPHITGK